jgi:hypothetical protein
MAFDSKLGNSNFEYKESSLPREEHTVEVLFESPESRIPGKEKKSKLLKTGSPFYNWMKDVQQILINNGFIFDARAPHIAIIGDNVTRSEEEDISNKRTAELQGQRINPLENFEMMPGNKALVVWTGDIADYGPTHATVAYFKPAIDDEQVKQIKQLVVDNMVKGGKKTNNFKRKRYTKIYKKIMRNKKTRRNKKVSRRKIKSRN